MEQDSLLHWSGGLDSTLCLYLELKAGRSPLVHHIVLKTNKGRDEYETAAIDAIVEWFRSAGFPEFRFLRDSEFRGGAWWEPSPDMEVLALFTGKLLRKYRSLKRVITPSIADQSFASDPNYIGNRARNTIIRSMARRSDWKTVRPINHMSKAQVIASLPEDLARLCWYCRYPTSSGEVCHSCRTCSEVDAALVDLGRGSLR